MLDKSPDLTTITNGILSKGKARHGVAPTEHDIYVGNFLNFMSFSKARRGDP